MLSLLVLFGGLHHALAADIPKDTNYVIRQNVSCPASGFLLQRGVGSNSLDSDTCYLCFCQNNDAVCWRRENRGCDLEHYRNLGQRNPRARRSFGEVFLRDAARDFFNKQSPEQCKPFESSFSDGCPPADWCIGCTVCDCDANGRWDCHVLSFCTDKKGNKKMKKRRGYPRNHNSKKQSKTSTTLRSMKTTTKPPKKPSKKRFVNPNMRRNQVKQSSAINKHKINQVNARKVNKVVAVKKPLPKLQAKKAIPNRNRVTSRPLYIKKNVSTSKPINIKSRNDQTKNNNIHVAQQVVKQFMSTVQKVIKNIDLKTNKTLKQQNKVLNKRSMPKSNNKKDTKEGEQKPKFIPKSTSNINRKELGNINIKKSQNSNKYGRMKRQVTTVENSTHANNSHYVRNLNGKTVNFTQLKNSINRETYITDNYIHVDGTLQRNIVRDGPLHSDLSNTDSTVYRVIHNYGLSQNNSNNNVQDVLILTTDRPHLSSNLKQFDDHTSTHFKHNLLEQDKNDDNGIFKKEKKYSNVSIQTESHSCKFRTILETLIGTGTVQYNNTLRSLETLKKPKRYTILTKIKRLLKKIFNKRNRNIFYRKDDLYYIDNNLKQSVYKKSRNCKLDTKEKEKLRKRIYELKNESENILKTIGIIKGLLHILEINNNETLYSYTVSKEINRLNENINKLNKIVKNTYFDEEEGKKLTEDQRTQINYIKDNVQVFITSIGKFARILDDVIQITTCHNKRENKIDNIIINKSNYTTNNIVTDYGNTTQIKLEKLKKLIFNYNILQNKFISQIFVILNNLEAKIAVRNSLQSKTIAGSEHLIEVNKTNAIETNSVNIIKNIRKLKLLAERMNAQRRRKRETIDGDDALEYLLMLMEYLLKRHGPTNPSVNDGLDLLIEAIKSAPDIKLIRKKVLDNATVRNLVTRSTPTRLLKKYNKFSTFNTIREQKNYSSEINKDNIKITYQSEDDVDDDEDKIEEIYRSFKSNKDLNSEQVHDNILMGRSNISITSESYYNVQGEATTHTSHNKDKEALRYKTLDDTIEEEVTTTPSNTVSDEIEISSVRATTEDSIVINSNIKNHVISNSDTDNFLVDPKANIDWIEENFKEIKQSREVETRQSTPKSLTATRTQKHIENISDVTNENETYIKKKADKTSGEEIMSKKQLDLLNSLDYVEDELDSKDDKFLSDTYV